EFFLLFQQSYLDGRKLGPEEDLYELAPDLFIRGAAVERDRRTKSVLAIRPITNREAVVWCVNTQIPKPLRGYLLDILCTVANGWHYVLQGSPRVGIRLAPHELSYL